MNIRPRQPRTGLTMVEVLLSTLLMGVLMVSSLHCVATVFRTNLAAGDSDHANQLLHQLMSEILEQDYLEATDPPAFGLETPESGGQRTHWDDVDDYHLWSANPPQDRDGTELPNSTGWRRDVVVEWVDPSDPSVVVGSDLGLKRITVTVLKDGELMAEGTVLRSDKYSDE